MKLKSIIQNASAIALILTSTLGLAGPGGHDASQSIGKAGKAAMAKRSVKVNMTDSMRFTPSSITVKKGETIKFIVTNSGKIKHEMVLGTQSELKEHYEVMKKNPEMEHADDNQVTVQPGKAGTIVWQFTKAGTVNFACLQPGHYDAGMKGEVIVGKKNMVSDKLAAPVTQTKAPVAQAQAPQAATPAQVPAQMPAQMPAKNAADLTDGEIRKVDMDSKKITIKHGDIKNLDMPGMTMVFQVKDVAMLDKVKQGDKVKFNVEKISGAFIVTELFAKK